MKTSVTPRARAYAGGLAYTRNLVMRLHLSRLLHSTGTAYHPACARAFVSVLLCARRPRGGRKRKKNGSQQGAQKGYSNKTSPPTCGLRQAHSVSNANNKHHLLESAAFTKTRQETHSAPRAEEEGAEGRGPRRGRRAEGAAASQEAGRRAAGGQATGTGSQAA